MTEHSANRIVVTGSSSGIGRAVAQRMAAAGFDILVHGCRNQAGAEETAKAVRAAGRDAEVVMADLSLDSGRDRLLQACSRSGIRPCGWAHCAGADVLTTELQNAPFIDKLDRLWQVDVRGTMLLARAAVQQLLEGAATNASMVFIGWDQALYGMEGEAGQMFGPIKAAITSFAMNLAQEVAPAIRVNVVAPGWIRTAWGDTTDTYWDRRAKQSALMGRWGTPEDVATAVEFFLRTHTQFVTGQLLEVNGGWNRSWRRDLGTPPANAPE